MIQWRRSWIFGWLVVKATDRKIDMLISCLDSPPNGHPPAPLYQMRSPSEGVTALCLCTSAHVGHFDKEGTNLSRMQRAMKVIKHFGRHRGSGRMEADDGRRQLLEWSFGDKVVGWGMEGYVAFG